MRRFDLESVFISHKTDKDPRGQNVLLQLSLCCATAHHRPRSVHTQLQHKYAPRYVPGTVCCRRSTPPTGSRRSSTRRTCCQTLRSICTPGHTTLGASDRVPWAARGGGGVGGREGGVEGRRERIGRREDGVGGVGGRSGREGE